MDSGQGGDELAMVNARRLYILSSDYSYLRTTFKRSSTTFQISTTSNQLATVNAGLHHILNIHRVIFFSLGLPLKVLSTEKLIWAMQGVSWTYTSR